MTHILNREKKIADDSLDNSKKHIMGSLSLTVCSFQAVSLVSKNLHAKFPAWKLNYSLLRQFVHCANWAASRLGFCRHFKACKAIARWVCSLHLACLSIYRTSISTTLIHEVKEKIRQNLWCVKMHCLSLGCIFSPIWKTISLQNRWVIL